MRRIILFALLVFLPSAALAQIPKLTWLRYYTVVPGKDAEFLRMLRETHDSMLTGLIAEKKVTNWGIAVPLSHNEETWTHLVYISASDWSGIDAVVNKADAVMAALPEADRKRIAEGFPTALAPNGLHDTVLRHTVQSQVVPPKDFKLRYLVINEHPIAPGRDVDAVQLFNEWAKPILADLEAKGRVGPWGQSVQDIVVGEDWTFLVWYFLPDLAALDDVTNSLMALGPQRLRSYWLRLSDMQEKKPFRGQILRVIHAAP